MTFNFIFRKAMKFIDRDYGQSGQALRIQKQQFPPRNDEINYPLIPSLIFIFLFMI